MSDEQNPVSEPDPEVQPKAKNVTTSVAGKRDLSNEVAIDGSATLETKYL
ncbi:hypothetical protein [Nocardia colli]